MGKVHPPPSIISVVYSVLFPYPQLYLLTLMPSRIFCLFTLMPSRIFTSCPLGYSFRGMQNYTQYSRYSSAKRYMILGVSFSDLSLTIPNMQFAFPLTTASQWGYAFNSLSKITTFSHLPISWWVSAISAPILADVKLGFCTVVHHFTFACAKEMR